MADLTQVRPIPSPVDASLTVRTTGVVEAYDDRVSHKGNRFFASNLRNPWFKVSAGPAHPIPRFRWSPERRNPIAGSLPIGLPGLLRRRSPTLSRHGDPNHPAVASRPNDRRHVF
ncbi:hypothetical protein GW17_00044201 [Ensete ventricosum]|nr:hypothetical protein GW17_00044201 [Ensete ventricosum]